MDFNVFTNVELHSLSKIKKIKKFKKRKTIIRKLNNIYACNKIQRWFRRINSYNYICPISKEFVRYPCWGYKNGNKRNYYNLPVLAKYFSVRGDFRDPISRSDITIKHIKELEKIIRAFPKININIVSVFRSTEKFKIKRRIDEQIEIIDNNFRTLISEIADDLKYIQKFVNTNEDLDVNELLSPKMRDIRMCLQLLSEMCTRTHTYLINWAISTFHITFEGEVEKIKIAIIELLEREIIQTNV